VVHRDIKPGNVLLDAAGNAYLTDFSISKVIEGTQTTLTGTGLTIGTPAYMPPEQGRQGEQPTPSADIYSLGVLLYEMVTGRLPFPGSDPIDVLHGHRHDQPPPPRRFRPDLPAAAEAAILKALEKQPQDRFATAGALARAFAAGLDNKYTEGLSENAAALAPTVQKIVLPETITARSPDTLPSSSGRTPGPRAVMLAVLAMALVVSGLAAALILSRGGGGTTIITYAPTATPYPPTSTTCSGCVPPTPYPPTATPNLTPIVGTPTFTSAVPTSTFTSVPPTPTFTSIPPTSTPLPSTAVYGDGSDGPRTISSSIVDSPVDATVSGAAGSKSLSFSNASGTFQSGQQVLIHQSQGAGTGMWMENRVTGASGSTLSLASPLNGNYTSGAQVLVMPQYTNVTVSSGVIWTAKAWNGNTGGILAFVANGTVTVNGAITATGKGYRGGSNIAGPHTLDPNVGGIQGEGTNGQGSRTSVIGASPPPNGSGGGGGGTDDTNPNGLGGARGGGAGGGNNGSGGSGVNAAAGPGGIGGTGAGSSDGSLITYGGGGGSGGNGHDYYLDGWGNDIGGDGGLGGGAVIIFGATITVNYLISADGGAPPHILQDSYCGQGDGRAGGGGAGGYVLIQSLTPAVGKANVSASGAQGGTSEYMSSGTYQTGGNGANGYVVFR
jgi:serine/threonine protein kinase